MSRLRTVTALTTTALWLSAVPGALASTSLVGNSAGTPTANICQLSFDCTYINYKHGKPTDVVKHSGTLVDWSLNAGSVNGQVRLRILRPVAHGNLKFVHSSTLQTVLGAGGNTFSAHIKVKAGDVLAVTNATSGIYMTSAPSGSCVQYFDSSIPDGVSGKPNNVTTGLLVLLSAHVKR